MPNKKDLGPQRVCLPTDGKIWLPHLDGAISSFSVHPAWHPVCCEESQKTTLQKVEEG